MNDLVAIANYKTKAEAEAAAGLLKYRGIPYLIQSQEGMLHGPLFPGATIYVTSGLVRQARDILGLDDEEEVGLDEEDILSRDDEDDDKYDDKGEWESEDEEDG
ncbi:MAG: hypothetical protein PVI01_04735 [Gemmatimonadales bacterium]|jgi:hypothetical protein